MSRRTLVVATALGLAIGAGVLVLIHPRASVPTILMYHSVTDGDDEPDPSVGLRLFKRQMAFLSTHGYETVFVKTIVDRRGSAQPIPSRWVALTFDGGYEDFHRNVYPVLKHHGLRATLFVIVAEVETEGGVTWAQLREMSGSGLVEIGSHSYHHVADACLSAVQARAEEARAKAVLEHHLGLPVVTYAYPYGAFSERAAGMLRELGYRGATGTAYRRDKFEMDDVFNLRRVYVSKYSAIPLMFRFMLSGYYVPTRELILRVLNIKAPRDVECPRVLGRR